MPNSINKKAIYNLEEVTRTPPTYKTEQHRRNVIAISIIVVIAHEIGSDD